MRARARGDGDADDRRAASAGNRAATTARPCARTRAARGSPRRSSKPLMPPCSAPRRWSGLARRRVDVERARTRRARRRRARARRSAAARRHLDARARANATPMTIAPPPSEPSGSRRSSRARARATATNANQPKRLARSAAPSSAGKSSHVSSRFETPKKRLVSSGPIGASESVEGRTAIEAAYATSNATSAKPSCVFLRKNVGPKSPPAIVQRPSSVTRGRGVAGREPAEREVAASAAPSAVGAPAREEEREHHEQPEHEHRRGHRRAARDVDLRPRAGTRSRRRPPSRARAERVRRLQRGARDVGDRHEAGHARQARA